MLQQPHVPLDDDGKKTRSFTFTGPVTEEREELHKQGLTIKRIFTHEGIHPYDQVQWETRTASITGADGAVVFQQDGVEVPSFWSQLATNIVASKYFRGQLGTPEREYSVKQLIDRVVDTITVWGIEGKYFASSQDAEIFNHELTYLLLHQYLAFNSPVWFNVGVVERPQASACFLLSIEDAMESILEWYKNEGMIFKSGSGSGINLSNLRAKGEPLSKGGTSSGVLSFMKAADSVAGSIKSGGATRRAAAMRILDIDHPDIKDFIWCKVKEEKKAYSLINAGYDPSIDGEAYQTVTYQNANNSVSVTDAFMNAVLEDRDWRTIYRTTRGQASRYSARALMKEIAQAAWECGDPGLFFYDTINSWHTTPNHSPITHPNPCGEYLHIPNSACNLASLNLLKFLDPNNQFNIESFCHAVDITLLAQEIIVSNTSYPTPTITKNAEDFRQLGLGYSNLGALLMAKGLPYDSEEGRNYAAAITSLMGGEAYRMSALIAKEKGAFNGFEVNQQSMRGIIGKHLEESADIIYECYNESETIALEANIRWEDAYCEGEKYGFRNAQTTLLAPTGTISFMMGCDTTGIEPAIALVSYKSLVGGGTLKLANNGVKKALANLGYGSEEQSEILSYIEEHDTIDGCKQLREEHLPVFDCAFRAANGTREIDPMGHVKMVAAVQPFLSGGISKTINVPNHYTSDDIYDLYIEAWKQGLKAISVYRDGCKRSQPLNTKKSESPAIKKLEEGATPSRRRLPNDCVSLRHKFQIAGHEGYLHVGMYLDGNPGEIFVCMAKEGSTISGLMDTIATITSLALQYGVPLETLVDKFSHVRFEPSGFTKNPDIPYAKSLTDYIFQFLGKKFLSSAVDSEATEQDQPENVKIFSQNGAQLDAPMCANCGTIMVRQGACFYCQTCGVSSGCS